MADVVQYRMERMADELDDLERRGLFSGEEIAEIVRRRRDFEYRLKRRSPLKQDFIAYIEYEKQLDALRSLRKRAIIGKLADKGIFEKNKKKKSKIWKRSLSDIAGVLRILDIYRMVTMRYRGDLDLWFKYLEFCRDKRHGRMKQVLAQAIRYHPKVPGLWIYAAAWEFDQNLNVAAARALMQNGLRTCPDSEDLWLEYLRMELTYLNKLIARKVALGDVTLLQHSNNDSDQWKEENKDLLIPFIEEQASDVHEGALEKREELFLQQGALVLQTIYHGAIEAIPLSITLRQKFVEIFDAANITLCDKLKVEVLEHLKKDFLHNEDYWDWFAQLQIGYISDLNNSESSKLLTKLDRAIQVYEEALNILPTAKMFSLYAKFLLNMVTSDGENSISAVNNMFVDDQDAISSILKLYERAESSGCLNEDLACQYVTFYLQSGRLNEAKNLAKKLCTGKLAEATNLWILRSSIEIKCLTNKSLSISKEDLNSIFNLLKDVLNRLPISKTENLWLMVLKFFSNYKEYFQKLLMILETALGKAGSSYSGTSVASAVLNLIFQREGIQQTRGMYKRLLSLPHPSVKLFRHCIELESNLGFVGDKFAITCARNLYNSALDMYPEIMELWREYYLMEKKAGTTESANAVYWRAKKISKDTMLLVGTDL
ncbi:U3 small nucleolar RNA-associated protein 6 homolog [Zingiber officinale]|nr:U3 small nucleolar RNA-associated protein 6 homolog [Zingiber officinale]